jgi:transcriptional regulator with XRE-family HTH domain
VNVLKNLQENLKRLRKEQYLTQEGLAEKAGLEAKHYQKIESCRWPGLQLQTIETLAAALGIEAWELICPPFRSKPKADQKSPRAKRL